MLALDGTVEGVIWWLTPWRAMKAISSPPGSAKMVTGDDGLPHGWTEWPQHPSFCALLPFESYSVDLDIADMRKVVKLVETYRSSLDGLVSVV